MKFEAWIILDKNKQLSIGTWYDEETARSVCAGLNERDGKRPEIDRRGPWVVKKVIIEVVE